MFSLEVWFRAARWRSTMRRRFADQRGQTSTEYLMIAGLTAAVIVVAFVAMYWPQVNSGVREFIWKVFYSVSGDLDNARKEVK